MWNAVSLVQDLNACLRDYGDNHYTTVYSTTPDDWTIGNFEMKN